MTKANFFYTIRDCQDGSAAVSFHADKETAQLACDIEDEGGQPFCDNWPQSHELKITQGKAKVIYTIHSRSEEHTSELQSQR